MDALKKNMTATRSLILLMGCFLVAHGLMANDFELPPPPSPLPTAQRPQVQIEWIEGLIDMPAMPEMPAMREVRAPEISVATGWGKAHADARGLDDQSIEAMLQAIKSESPSRTTLESMLFDQLRTQLPRLGEGYVFEKVMMPSNIELPSGGWQVNYTFRLPRQGLGSTPFSAGVSDGQGKMIKRFSGSVYLDREARGLQVIHRIRQGERIGHDDLVLVEGRLSQIPRGTFEDYDRIVGTMARNELRPGQWLTDRLVSTPDVVKRGQAVTMRLVRGQLKISAPGIVRQDAGLGELIRVQNAQSGKELYAKVVSNDEVQVIF